MSEELKDLDLSRCVISKESARIISQLSLNKLILSYTEIDPSAFKILFCNLVFLPVETTELMMVCF